MKDPAPLYLMLSRLGNGLSPLKPLKELQVTAAPVPRVVHRAHSHSTLHICSFTSSGGSPPSRADE